MKYFVASDEDRRLDPAIRRTLRGSFVDLTDGVTHYELTGPDGGELVVLVGGLTIPLSYWDGLAARLHTRGMRTLAYSAYGRGYSDRIRGRYDEALFIRQLAELTSALDPTPPRHVVGTSMGALVAMAYANLHPESVATLTVAGPAGLGERPRAQRLLRNDLLAGFVARRFGRKLAVGACRRRKWMRSPVVGSSTNGRRRGAGSAAAARSSSGPGRDPGAPADQRWPGADGQDLHTSKGNRAHLPNSLRRKLAKQCSADFNQGEAKP
ncbi:alpha/beta hydrolase [Amycolatopsis sp. H6(2020)]|nr:alpha/beta hydrolase [Amycolatopsis sp. H6(2020)]